MQDNIFRSSVPENLPQAVVKRLQDPRMRFRTVISLLSLLRRVFHIKAAERQGPPSPKLNRHQGAQLRAMVALATLLVRHNEVTATVGSPEQAIVAYNASTSESGPPDDRYTPQRVMTARNPRNKDMDNPSRIPIPNADDLTMTQVLTYLIEVGANQHFDDHAKFIMQFANQCRPNASGGARDLLARQFVTYVIGSSAPKMLYRINHSKYSQPYFNGIVGLPASDVEWVGEKVSPPNWFDMVFIDALHSNLGVRYLQGVHRIITQPPTSPHWERLIKELPACGAEDPNAYQLLFPNLWNLTPKSKALYTQATYHEFHQILSTLLLGYRDSLKRLVGLKKPTEGELGEAIGAVRDCLVILHPIAHSAAVVDHLSVVADAVSGREDQEPAPAAQEPSTATVIAPNGEEEDHEEIEMESEETTLEDSADMDVTDTEAPYPSRVDTPYIRWLKLQVSYISAPNHIISLFQFDAHLPNPIELAIYPIRYTGKAMAPLIPILEGIAQNHPQDLATAGRPIDIGLVKEAFATMMESEHTDPLFGRTLNRMHRGSGFSGRIHCEAALAALLFGPTINNPPMYDKNTIGVSKRCCPVCSAILEELSLEQPINILGSHRTIMPCALPDTLPPEVVDRILHKFERQLALALRDLYILSQLQHSRGSSRSSANSHPLSPSGEPTRKIFEFD